MGRYPFWFFSMFPALPHFRQLSVVCGQRASRAENRKKELDLNLFGILNFEFQPVCRLWSAVRWSGGQPVRGQPLVVSCQLSAVSCFGYPLRGSDSSSSRSIGLVYDYKQVRMNMSRIRSVRG